MTVQAMAVSFFVGTDLMLEEERHCYIRIPESIQNILIVK